MQDHAQPPINPLPPVVVALFLFMAGIEIYFSGGARGFFGGPEAVGWRLDALQRYAFSQPVFAWMIETGQWPVEHLFRFVSYPFVHGDFTHALFACVILLAIGKIVAEALGSFAFLAVFVLSSIGGALAYGLFLTVSQPLFGGYPPVYGLIGAFTYLLWLRLGQLGEAQVRAFTLIGFLLGIQLVFGLLFGGGYSWVADLAGFATGFAAAIVLVPGGIRHLLNKIRR